MFFGTENNTAALGSFLQRSRAIHVSDETRSVRLALARQVIAYIYKSPKDWDERCSFNIKYIGNQFINQIESFNQDDSEDIDDLYSMTYRFLCEFDFLIGAGRELSMEMRSIRNKMENDTAEMSTSVKSQMIYASYAMPASITKELINDENFTAFKSFELKKTEAEKLKTEWDREIEQKKTATEELKNKLEEYKIGFNFVGLYKGFSDLSAKKAKESLWLFWSLLAMGSAIILPLLIEIIILTTSLTTRSYEEEALAFEHLIILIPLISMQIILIYFFRVILNNYRSVKAQIMQLELRQTLCQFIQSYAGYSMEIKKQDSNALEKFESLIFSGILSDPEKLPSTFDGLEHIGNLIKSVKGT